MVAGRNQPISAQISDVIRSTSAARFSIRLLYLLYVYFASPITFRASFQLGSFPVQLEVLPTGLMIRTNSIHVLLNRFCPLLALGCAYNTPRRFTCTVLTPVHRRRIRASSFRCLNSDSIAERCALTVRTIDRWPTGPNTIDHLRESWRRSDWGWGFVDVYLHASTPDAPLPASAGSPLKRRMRSDDSSPTSATAPHHVAQSVAVTVIG